ncbi:MAG TPA: LemA family protein, partial [Acidimicrobiia bacterium]
MAAVIIIVVIVVLAILFFVFAFNGAVRLRNRVDSAWSQISVQLQRRHDLIPNLIETVKGYAAHESSTLEAVTAARTSAVQAQQAGPAQQAQAENVLSGALRQLFALSESYPDL